MSGFDPDVHRITPAMLRGYLELLRPANITTALADVLAGYAVAGLGHPRALPWLLGATACLYAGGIVLNDVFDRNLDAVERPERPIPSGRVRTSTAVWLGAGLLAAGVLLASRTNAEATLVAAAIATAVLLYDGLSKRNALLGPMNMGTCRALNLLLGVAAVPAALATGWPLAAIPFVYITAITALSRGEVAGGTRPTALISLALLIGVLAALTTLALQPPGPPAAALLLTLFLAWRVIPPFWRAFQTGGPRAIRRAVRAGVLSLVLVDAVIAATYADMIYSLAVLATAGLAAALARLFPVT
jgi:4-hydroxybenzoate polyprenyltransferase